MTKNKKTPTTKYQQVKLLDKETEKTLTKTPAKKEKPKPEGLLGKYVEFMKASNKKKVEAKATPAVPETTIDLDALVSAQLTARVFAPITPDELTKPVTFVVAANGLFKVTKTPVAMYKVMLEEFDTPVKGIPEMEEGVELLIPKIPFKNLIKALSFYRDVNDKDGDEASLLFFWNYNNVALPNIPGVSQEGQLITYCPVQTNSGALSDFTKDTWVDWFRENTALLLETHSHNTMSAFFSGTDDANENMNQFYAVWGHVDNDEPMFAFRWVCGDHKIECSPDVLIEWPTVTYKETIKKTVESEIKISNDLDLLDVNTLPEEATVKNAPEEVKTKTELVQGPFKQIDYPLDWMSQHTSRKYTNNFKYKSLPNKKQPYYNNPYGDIYIDDLTDDEDYYYGQYDIYSYYDDTDGYNFNGMSDYRPSNRKVKTNFRNKYRKGGK